jgi:hypothetical protein
MSNAFRTALDSIEPLMAHNQVSLGRAFFIQYGQPTYSFHSLSVTLVSRLMLHLHKVTDIGILTEHDAETSLYLNSRHLVHSDEESTICGEE